MFLNAGDKGSYLTNEFSTKEDVVVALNELEKRIDEAMAILSGN